MATDYGTSIIWPGDRPLIMVPTSDPFVVVGQRLWNRFRTPRGGLAVIGGDPNFGWDVRRYVLSRVSGMRLSQAEKQVQDEAEKDEAVQSALVSFDQSGLRAPLVINLDCTLAIGPMQLVLNVTALTVDAVYNYG